MAKCYSEYLDCVKSSPGDFEGYVRCAAELAECWAAMFLPKTSRIDRAALQAGLSKGQRDKLIFLAGKMQGCLEANASPLAIASVQDEVLEVLAEAIRGE